MSDIIRRLNDEGLLIEAGWITQKQAGAPDEHRDAFFLGAEYVYIAILQALDLDNQDEEAEGVLDSIRDELGKFRADYDKRNGE